jgi:cytoskeletal protein CcmA (bactofilin family)
MFSKDDATTIKTLIAKGTRIEGSMKFEGGLRVDGEVYGAIRASSGTRSLLVISEGAIVEGGLVADHVIINGTVRGPVEAREMLELQPKAKVDGEVQYVALEVHQGAAVLGKLRPMTATASSEEEDTPPIRLAANGGAVQGAGR